jgi:hypothetical protein
MSCGHCCELICHGGDCSKSSDCTQKVAIKCVCRTLRRSFVCKELKFEKDNLIEKSVKGELKMFLKCSEKCKSKQSRLETAESVDETLKEKKPVFTINFRYLLVGFLVLFFAILIYYFSS